MEDLPECPPEFASHTIVAGYKAHNRSVYITYGRSSLSFEDQRYHVVLDCENGGHWLAKSFYDEEKARDFGREYAERLRREKEPFRSRATDQKSHFAEQRAIAQRYADHPAWGAF